MSNVQVSNEAIAPNAKRLLFAGFMAILAAGVNLTGENFGNIANPNRNYIFQVYVDLLNRSPELGGLLYWSNRLDNGDSRYTVIQAIQGTPEYKQDVIDGVYLALLGRHVDPSGLQFGLSLLNNQPIATPGSSPLDILRATILGSQEYFQLHGSSNLGFLQALFLDVLKRPIDPSAQNFYLSQLNSGTSRTLVAKIILGTTEAKQDGERQQDQESHLHPP